MNKMTQINIRVDEEIKRNAELVCEDIGMSLSTAINIYLKKLVKERRIPFEVSADPFYSVENLKRLEKSIKQLENSGGKVHSIDIDDR